MSNNGPVKIRVDSDLANAAPASNVATKQAEAAAARERTFSIDGDSVFPEWVTTRGISLAESLTIGSGVSILDGTITSDMIGADQVTSTHINALDVTTSELSFASGSLSEYGISTLGTITGGDLSITGGGCTISTDGGTSGIYIGGSQIFMKYGGSTNILIDGTTGIITAKKLQITSDSDNQFDLSTGTHIFAEAITVGAGTTLGGMIDDTETAQSTANTAVSDAADAQADATQALSDASDANTNANGRITKSQTYIGLSGEQITTINTAGITIQTSASGARTYMDSNGIRCYNGSATVTQIDSTYGLWVNNVTATPGVTERASVAYNGTEKGWLGGWNTGAGIGCAGVLQIGSTVPSNTTQINLVTDAATQVTIDSGYLSLTTGNYLVFGSNSRLSSGAIGSISEGSSAAGIPLGSIYMSTGGSIWTVYTDGSPKWTKILTVANHQAVCTNYAT